MPHMCVLMSYSFLIHMMPGCGIFQRFKASHLGYTPPWLTSIIRQPPKRSKIRTHLAFSCWPLLFSFFGDQLFIAPIFCCFYPWAAYSLPICQWPQAAAHRSARRGTPKTQKNGPEGLGFLESKHVFIDDTPRCRYLNIALFTRRNPWCLHPILEIVCSCWC